MDKNGGVGPDHQCSPKFRLYSSIIEMAGCTLCHVNGNAPKRGIPQRMIIMMIDAVTNAGNSVAFLLYPIFKAGFVFFTARDTRIFKI